MLKGTAAKIVEELLSAYYTKPGEDRTREGLGSGMDSPIARIYLNSSRLDVAALLLRSCGPTYLKSMSVNQVSKELRQFFRDNYYLASQEVEENETEMALAAVLRKDTKVALVEAIEKSTIFQPQNFLTLFPIVPMKVDADFKSETFFVIDPKSLVDGYLPSYANDSNIIPDQMPPFANDFFEKRKVGAWLGIKSPSVPHSQKIKRIVLGAIALGVIQRERHSFTMRPTCGNYVEFTAIESHISTSQPHTPPLGNDIAIEDRDHLWLKELQRILLSREKKDKKRRNALEYYYRAWSLNETDRCPVLFVVLDSIFGKEYAATKAAIEGIQKWIEPSPDYCRLRLLMDIRNSVLHGGAPDVYASKKYQKYYLKYKVDPIYDLDLIVAKCLQNYIFTDYFRVQPDPITELIGQQQKLGNLAINSNPNAII